MVLNGLEWDQNTCYTSIYRDNIDNNCDKNRCFSLKATRAESYPSSLLPSIGDGEKYDLVGQSLGLAQWGVE